MTWFEQDPPYPASLKKDSFIVFYFIAIFSPSIVVKRLQPITERWQYLELAAYGFFSWFGETRVSTHADMSRFLLGFAEPYGNFVFWSNRETLSLYRSLLSIGRQSKLQFRFNPQQFIRITILRTLDRFSREDGTILAVLSSICHLFRISPIEPLIRLTVRQVLGWMCTCLRCKVQAPR